MKYFLLAASFLILSACAGGPSAEAELSSEQAVEQIDPNVVKTTADETLASEKQNHELRKEIFKLQGKLGLPQDGGEQAPKEKAAAK